MNYIVSLNLIAVSLSFADCFDFFNYNHDVLQYEEEAKHNPSQVTEEWIEQPLDHFNENEKTWKMRYFKRLDLWKPNGPIYLYINGEWDASPLSLQVRTLLSYQLANETDGALFSTEHRYYGGSIPIFPTTTPWLEYLSAKQALADLAFLVKTIKSAPQFKSSKVVAIGGSYAGNLAAWMKVLYPDLIDAAVSSSGPVLAKKDFYEYLETVNDVYEKYGSPECLGRIQRKFNHYTEMLKTQKGIEKLKREKSICNETDMTILNNQRLFMLSEYSVFQSNVQYGNPGRIKKHCEELQAKNWTKSDSDNCETYDFEELIDSQRVIYDNFFYWMYQTCTEFGYFQTTTSVKQPFNQNVGVDLFTSLCRGFYGEEFDEERVDKGVADSNNLYGGIAPNVTNVIFTHGDMDPWHRLGVLNDLSETAPVIITNGTSHCNILNYRKREPKQLTEDREHVKTLIKKWIA